MNDKTSKVNKGNVSFDKKGLIFEAYNIEDIGTKSCKTIFFDWAIDLEIETDQKHAISKLLDEYGSKYPSHPMTILLLSGLKTLDQKDKRKRKRKRKKSS